MRGDAGLRVLHVLDHSIPLHSGYTFRTLAILREQARLGWTTSQITTPKQGATQAHEETVEGAVFFRTPNRGDEGLLRQMRLTAARLHEAVQETRPHLIHAHSPVLNALPSLWVGRRHRLPVVYEMRSSWEDAAVDHGTTTEGSARYRLSRAIESFVLWRADQITTICEGLRRDIAVRGIADARITVIPNAVDAQAFQFGVAGDPELRRSLGLEGADVLGFAGSFYGYEGVELLVEAAASLMARRPTLRVLLVGGGFQEENLKRRVEKAGLQGRIIFTGRVPHAQVQRYYEMIDVLVYPRLPIRLTELVTPLKPLEAMAQGRIVLASDVGGHRELIRDGDTGYLFPPGDVAALAQAIETVLAQREAWPQMRRRARAFVESERTWARSVARYRDVYARALGERGPALVAEM